MGGGQLRSHLRRLLLLAGAVALFDRRRDECEEAASKREDSQENYAYLALSAASASWRCFKFDSYKGRYVLHCHNLEHEDMMMMANFEVV